MHWLTRVIGLSLAPQQAVAVSMPFQYRMSQQWCLSNRRLLRAEPKRWRAVPVGALLPFLVLRLAPPKDCLRIELRLVLVTLR